MTTSTIATCDHGIVTKTKRVILDRDVYDRKWKLGPFAKKKEALKQNGKLDKYGRITESTPEAWKLLFGEPEKGTNIEAVGNKLGVKKELPEVAENGSKTKKAAVVNAESEEEAEEEEEEDTKTKKKDKKHKDKQAKKEKKDKKKDKKDKKEKKDKKKKKKDSDDEEESDDE